MEKIKPTVLNNLASNPFYLIDYDHELAEMFITKVADKKKLKTVKQKPSFKGIGFEAPTVEKDSLKKDNKYIKKEENKMESSLRNLQELK